MKVHKHTGYTGRLKRRKEGKKGGRDPVRKPNREQEKTLRVQ